MANNDKSTANLIEDAFRRKTNTPTRDEEEEEKLKARKAALEQLQRNPFTDKSVYSKN